MKESKVLELTALVIFIRICLEQCGADTLFPTDACIKQKRNNYGGYVFLDRQSEWRSTEYYAVPEIERPNCDKFIETRWYRINSKAGETMPETCVTTKYQCNTVFPMWLSGRHPTESDGITTRDVCITNTDLQPIDCCYLKVPIRIRNCGDFYVYELQPAPDCDMGYCFGNETKCPPGQASETGYTPGCKDAVNYRCSSAELSVGISSSRQEMEFYCDIECDTFTNGDSGQISIEWYFNDQIVHKSTLLNGPRDILQEGDWVGINTLGKHVKCKATPILVHPLSFGISVMSSFYFAGIKVLNTNIELEEGEEALITFQLTVPFLCKLPDIYLQFCPSELSVIKGYCHRSFHTEESAVLGFKEILPYRWDNYTGGVFHTVHFPIEVTSDFLYGGPKKRLIHFRTSLVHGNAIWNNYNAGEVAVTIIDRNAELGDSRCSANNTCSSFDGTSFDVPNTGKFILYEHTELAIKVHIFKLNCSTSASCVCGLSVSVGNDVVEINRCSSTTSSTGVYHNGRTITRIKDYLCDKLESGFHIEEDSNGYQFHLPTGGKVILTGGRFFRVDITPSSRDWGNTTGLCGTLNRDCKDDFTLRNGSVIRGDRAGCSLSNEDKPIDFILSWRDETFYELTDPRQRFRHEYCTSPGRPLDIQCSYEDSNLILGCNAYTRSDVAITVTTQASNISKNAGESVELMCHFELNSTRDFIFFDYYTPRWAKLQSDKNQTSSVSKATTVAVSAEVQTIFKNTGRYSASVSPSNPETYFDMKLVVNNIRAEDAGEYKCEIHYDHGVVGSVHHRLNVYVAPVTEHDKDITTTEQGLDTTIVTGQGKDITTVPELGKDTPPVTGQGKDTTIEAEQGIGTTQGTEQDSDVTPVTEQSKGLDLPIIGGLVGVIVILIITVLIICFRKRKNNNNSDHMNMKNRTSENDLQNSDTKGKQEPEPDYEYENEYEHEYARPRSEYQQTETEYASPDQEYYNVAEHNYAKVENEYERTKYVPSQQIYDKI